MTVSGKAGSRLLAVCILLCLAASVRASTFVMPTDDEMVIRARAIVRGKVLAIESGLDDKRDAIYTYITLKVQEVLKGQLTQHKIVIKQPGGEYGSRGSVVFGSPAFSTGENVILYLDTWRDGSLRVHQMLLGKFAVITDPNSGKLFAVRNVAETGVRVLDQSGRGSITNRMELSAYTEMVRQRLGANRTAARQFDRDAYGNIPILDQPVGYSRSAERGDLEPQFHLWNPPTSWFEADNGQSVVFRVNTENAPPQVENDVVAATNAWSSVQGCSLRVTDGGTTHGCGLYSLDGENTISFNNCDGYFSGSGTCSSGVLAVTSIANYDRFQTRVVNGVTFYRAIEANLSFNPFASCYFSDHIKLQEIMTHEMGHALGLHHSWDSTFPGTPSPSDQVATMYWVAHFDGRAASLRQDDIDGITFIYPSQGGGPGPLTIVSSSPLGTATVGSAFTRQLIASGGTQPYTWSLASGSLPVGLVMTPNGLIGGTPTAAGTSNFTVRVTDAQSGSAQKDLQIIVITPATGYDSHFVSQEVQATLQPGQSFLATIRWINTGSSTWNGLGGFAIMSQNPANNLTWGGNQVPWVNGPVPPGEQMELLFIAYAPTRSGTYDFQWQLFQQGVGFFGEMSANISIVVGDGGPPPTQPPTINGPSSLAAVTGTPLSATFTATGGTPPYTWQLPSGALPAGVAMNPGTGAITGTPTAAGNYTVVVQVTDAATKTAQKSLAITVAAPPVTITTGSISTATRGTSFSQQLTAMGGKPPYTWTVTTGALPAGLGLAASTGFISGNPTAIGDFGFTVTATDSESHTASKALTITVAPQPLLMASVPSLNGLMGSSFSFQLNANGGIPAYIWSVTSGAFPAGLSLNPSSGLISGVPAVAGLFTFTVAVRDQGAGSAAANIQISLVDPATIPAITRAKYKGAKKLMVTGLRVNPAAILFVDGNQMSAAPDNGSFLVKPIVLVRGTHEIKIVNPGGMASQPFMLTVE
ncbi:MAG TPA: putative Ig domain-containing protein [Blastocatellia bacterium]|nr:putative Ig domain-containing protein [Blastocatellia bacterium]